ncbi:MAG: hypothetical protein PUB13_03850 [Lachnospiraceae bacterium]|nr:hypothetical protein [Lachnospiraceae bacterium]
MITGIFLLSVFYAQKEFAHRNGIYRPKHQKLDILPILEKESLSQDDYEILFSQTGLSKEPVDLLLSDQIHGKERLLSYQEAYFRPRYTKCTSIFGPFVCTDVLTDASGAALPSPEIVLARPGDILVSFSTHSFGWRHGHAALVLDKNRTIECRVIGTKSSLSTVSRWKGYSCYAVLRVKNVSPKRLKQAASFAENHLYNLPYRLLSSLFYPTSASYDKLGFGVNCSTLIWYAYESIGINLNSSSFKITTPHDLFTSPMVEVIQIYGMDMPSS